MTEGIPSTVRRRIQQVEHPVRRLALMATYLWDARVSEVVSRASPGDKGTTPRGPRGIDCRKEVYEYGELKVPVAVFQLTSSHGSGRPRACALPLEARFEPWTSLLFNYFQRVGERYAFPFTRQAVGSWARDAFQGLTYPIEAYSIPLEEEGDFEGRVKKITKKTGETVLRGQVDQHQRGVAVHALRHIRALELVRDFGFNMNELTTYGGWTMGGGAMGGTRVLARYVQLNWRDYFPKLLRRQGGF